MEIVPAGPLPCLARGACHWGDIASRISERAAGIEGGQTAFATSSLARFLDRTAEWGTPFRLQVAADHHGERKDK